MAMRSILAAALVAAIAAALPPGQCGAGELAVEDFKFDGPIGSQGARVEKLGTNHFKITLSHQPGNFGWANFLQFQILRNAKGNDLRISAEFVGETGYAFVSNFSSWSHDGKLWQPIRWSSYKLDKETRTRTAELVFPKFYEDTVWFGFQVPMSYEDLLGLIAGWKKHPAVNVHVLGQSLGGRDIHRVEITDPKSDVPLEKRWVHYFANQHPLEHNAQWRMAAMIDWLLSDAGADARRRTMCHFIVKSSPDGSTNGWLRVNAEGIDMNRSYSRAGSFPEQGHEPYIIQKDLEGIMASRCPATTIWSMHTWPGPADPGIAPGPEVDNIVGPPTDFAAILERLDPQHQLVKKLRIGPPLRPRSKPWSPPAAGEEPKEKKSGASWSSGPGAQFGVTNLLCEGGGGLLTKRENLDSGVVLIRSLMDYYPGTKPYTGALPPPRKEPPKGEPENTE